MTIPQNGITADRSSPDRTDFIIKNHSKMSRQEIADKLGESPRWVKRQINKLIKSNHISPKRKKENPSVCLEDWSPDIVERVIYLKTKELKSYADISKILKKEFSFSVTGTVVGMWFRKFGNVSYNKIDWLEQNITKDIAENFIIKGMTLIEISKHIESMYSLYISDDLILTHFKNMGVMNQKQYMDYVPNDKGNKLSKKWFEDRINNHVSIPDMSLEAGVSKTIIMKRINEEGLSLIPHRKIWSDNLEVLRDYLLGIKPLVISDKLFHECMLGWLFGDGHIDINGRFVVNHSLKQIDYLYLKVRMLKSYLTNISTIARTNFSEDGTYIGSGEQINISCPGLKEYTRYLNEDGSKNFSKIAEEMTPLSWACLYMDDGSFYSSCTVISFSNDRCEMFKNRYPFGDYINEHSLEIKDINPDYIIPGMASKIPDIEVGAFWRKYAPELFDIEIKDDYQLSFLNNYLCEKNPKLLNRAVEYYQRRGFPYFKISEDYLYREFGKLKRFNTDYLWKKNNILKYLDVGNHIFKHFMPHMVEAKFRQISPYEVFNNYMQLRSVLEHTLKIKKSILPDFVYDNLIYFNGGVVGFPCSVAKAITHKYCVEEGTVVDPCAGWGGRLLGTITSGRKYIGFEPWNKTTVCIEGMIEFLKIDNAKVINSKFTQKNAPRYCDLVFTSPPYFDLEIYGKSITKKEWLSLMKSIFMYSERSLKKGSYLILNLPRSLKVELPSTTLKEFAPIYFHTSSRRKSTKKAEILFIWKNI